MVMRPEVAMDLVAPSTLRRALGWCPAALLEIGFHL